jgi:hypothetical protein
MNSNQMLSLALVGDGCWRVSNVATCNTSCLMGEIYLNNIIWQESILSQLVQVCQVQVFQMLGIHVASPLRWL